MVKYGIIFLLLLPTLKLSAQEISSEDGMGKTYYDEAKTRIKEIFHYVLEYRFKRDELNPDLIQQKSVVIKNGPYTLYHTNGKLMASGTYNRDKKEGTWKFYDREGNLLRTEVYKNDELVTNSEK